MCQYHGGGTNAQRVAKHVGHPYIGMVDASDHDRLDAQNLSARVEQHHPQVLLGQLAHLVHQQRSDVGRIADPPAVGRLREQQPARDLERRFDLRCLGMPDTVRAGKLRSTQALQAGPAAVVTQQALGELDGVGARARRCAT